MDDRVTYSTVNVVTHTAAEDFKFSSWEDKSTPVSSLDYLSYLLLARLKTYKIVEYSPQATSNKER